ncbi:reverse transcriptase N-terminal domain-containing protein [Tolypothrix sp. VBCCA 56010]|uniref:reverse transcriptase N-terminal domain-containing protein n=1 Tax=Tolypothrix sp. VBCCA 56010 TaxID=3137731 RepID=UPI003D7EE70F
MTRAHNHPRPGLWNKRMPICFRGLDMPTATLLHGMYVREVRGITLNGSKTEDVIDKDKTITPEDENAASEWRCIDWKKVEMAVFKLQKRIYKAELRGDVKRVRRLQKLMVHSRYAKLLVHCDRNNPWV